MINHSKESNVRKAKGEKLQKNIEAQGRRQQQAGDNRFFHGR